MRHMTLQVGASFVLGVALTFSCYADGVTFQLMGTLDTAALNAGQPGSVAAYGNDVYIGTLFGGARLHHITNPLGSPTNVNTFGGIQNAATNGGLPNAGTTTNGYVSLYTDGSTLIAATDNGGATPDIAQAFQFGTDVFKWGNHAAALPTQNGGTIDGAAIDPTTGNAMLTCFGCDAQNFFSASTGAAQTVAGANILFYPGVGTGWKDIDYDKSTGDIYLRAWGGIARGKKVGPGQFQTLEGGAGVQTIVDMDNNFVSAINVAFLPANFAGDDLVITNYRNGSGSFSSQIKVFDATPPSSGGTATETPIAATFLDAVGGAFNPASGSGIYDFSYDPVNKKLYVSDFSRSAVYIFGAVPEPSSVILCLIAFSVLVFRRVRSALG